MKEGLKLGIAILIAGATVFTFFFFKRTNAWWWGLRVRNRVALALAFTALIVGVGAYVKLG